MPLLLTDDLKKRIYAQHAGKYDESKFDIEATGEETFRFIPKAQPSFQPPAPDETTAELGAANVKPTSGPSVWESGARAAATSAIPTIAGVLTAAGAASMMAPEPTITKLIGLGLLGAGASMGASKLQSEVVPQSIQEKLFTRPQDVQENPIATAAGGFIPTALAFKPSIADIKTLASGARNMSWAGQGARGALTPEQAAALANAGVNLGVASGIEGYELAEGKPFNPLESAINVLPGALFTRPTAFGTKLGFGSPEVNKAPVMPDEPAPQGKPTTDTTDKTTQARMSGQTGEGVVISDGQVIPVGTTKLKEPDLTGEVRGKDPYQAMSGNTDDTIVGTPRPVKSAVDSAVAMEAAPLAEKKKVDYETSLREKAKQDADEVYRKAFEEAAEGKLIGSKLSAEPERRPAPIATTEAGKEILPDYTGVQEHDVQVNAKTPKTEAEWAQESFDRLEESSRRKYQAEQEGEALAQQDKLIADIEAEATRRQLKVRYVPEIKIGDKQKRGYYDPKTREVVISKSRATQDTPSHEVGHGYVDDLLASPEAKDHNFVLKGLEFADEQGRKFKTKADWEALTPEERKDIDERFVQLLGEEGAKQRKAELYGTKREKFSKWLENVGSNVKNKLGVGSAEDRARSVAVSQRHDLRTLGNKSEGGTVLPAPKFQDLGDYEQYQEVQAKIKALIAKGDFESPEFQALWKENEVIKNRNKGHVPKPPPESSEGGDIKAQPDSEKTTNEPLLLSSRFDKVAKLGTTGKEVSEKLKNFQSESEFLQGKYGNKVIAALKGYNETEITNVYKYRHAVSNGLETGNLKLSANEQKLKSALDSEFKSIGEDIIASGLEVKDSEDFRKMQLKPDGYQPNIIAQKVIHAWQENTTNAPKYDKLYIDYMEKKGLTEAEAMTQLKEYKQAVGNAGVTPDIRFNAIRKAEGLGLPFELVEQNPALAFRRYGRRAANDVSYFKYLQNDPRMLKALGIRDQHGKSVEELGADIQDSTKDVTWIGGSEEVKSALRSVYGIDTPMNQRGNAAIRAIANSVIQTGAAIRNIVGLPTAYAGYYGVTPKTLVEAITKMSERSARAFESNAVRSSFKDFDAAGIIEGHPDRFVELADKYSNTMRKWTGRDLSDKFEGELSYSLGETLAVNWLAQAKAGDIKARRMLNRFGGNVEGGIKEKFLPKAEVSQEDISRIAKNFVDATRGSYGPSGLPSSAIEGGAAPMLSLARWSIEKFNTFQKDVVRPITEHGDWMPLLKTTFAGLLTGAAIEKLNELLSQKKGADATIEEIWADGDIDAITHKVIGLLQLGGFAGILSDTMKATSAWSQGKDLAFSNPISMPALTLAEELFQNSGYAFEAAQQGEDKLEVLSKFLGDLLKITYQNARYVSNVVNKEETERKGKFRDLRVFRELEGKPPGDSSAGNPYLGMAAREFKRAEDLETAASKLPRALETAVKKAKGNYEDLVGNVEGLRKNSYQTFPADQMEASKYYQYLVKTIGVERANMRYADYLRQTQMNKEKSKMVPKLKSMFSRE